MATSRPLLPASAWNTEPLLRVHRNDRTFLMEVPATYFGPVSPFGHGSWERAQKLADWVRRIDGGIHEPDVGSALAWLDYCFKQGRNTEFWRDMPVFEARMERVCRAALGIDDPTPAPAPTPFQPTTPGRQSYPRPRVELLVWDWERGGTRLMVEEGTGNIYFTLRTPLHAPPGDERNILQADLAMLRSILGPAAVVAKLPVSDLLRRLHPLYPGDEPPYVPPVAEQPVEAGLNEAAPVEQPVETVEVKTEDAPVTKTSRARADEVEETVAA